MSRGFTLTLDRVIVLKTPENKMSALTSNLYSNSDLYYQNPNDRDFNLFEFLGISADYQPKSNYTGFSIPLDTLDMTATQLKKVLPKGAKLARVSSGNPSTYIVNYRCGRVVKLSVTRTAGLPPEWRLI